MPILYLFIINSIILKHFYSYGVVLKLVIIHYFTCISLDLNSSPGKRSRDLFVSRQLKCSVDPIRSELIAKISKLILGIYMCRSTMRDLVPCRLVNWATA